MLIYSTSVSVDGFIADRKRAFGVTAPDEELFRFHLAQNVRACRSLLHPWIVRRVGVHGRAAAIDSFGPQFVVPGFVAVDLA
jgi:hypothetical protein